jgi:hypothetical protein
MLLDNILAFSTDQDLSGLSAAMDSENFPLDTGVVDPNLGKGGEIGVMLIVKTAFAGGTDLNFVVYHGASSANAILISSPQFLQAVLVKGFTYFLPLPRDCSRYLGVTYNQTGDFTAGVVDCYLTVKQ